MLTAEVVADATVRPAWIEVYEGEDDEGNAQERYNIKLPAMADGESFVAAISGDPSVDWQEYDGKFGTSVLAFFKTEDDTTLSCFVRTGDNAHKTKGVGNTLYSRLCEFQDGDVVKVTLNERKSKNFPNATKLYVVEAADFQ